MPDRRWSDGLHRAVEAKEGVPIRQNSETAASVTYQNFFLLRLRYDHKGSLSWN